MSTVKLPTQRRSALQQRFDNYSQAPFRPLEIHLDQWDGSTATISPVYNEFDGDHFAIWIRERVHLIESASAQTIDLSTTGLGGLVDGIAQENGRDYLLWAFANNANTSFKGFAATRKPFSAFTAGTGNKGTTTDFTVTDAYQFTAGARVVVRNEDGTAPQYEWNWGTVNSIVNDTTLKVDLDNNSNYGSDITGTTNGEIAQWDKFRPWVVSSSDQQRYLDNYRLVGEVQTDGSGNIIKAYRADDPWRTIPAFRLVDFSGVGSAVSTELSMGRVLPLWAKNAHIYCRIDDGSGGFAANWVRDVHDNQRARAFKGGVDRIATSEAEVSLRKYARVGVSYEGDSFNGFQVQAYEVVGGMRE
jgi:hypothetical protein